MHHPEMYQTIYIYIVQPFIMYLMSKTINIEESLYEEMQQEAKNHNETLRAHVEHTLRNSQKRKELLKKVWKGLEVEKDEHTRIILKNLDERKFYDIEVSQNGTLSCKQCKSHDCKHTSFVWTQFEDLDIHLAMSKSA